MMNPDSTSKLPSERSFGLLFTVVFAAVGTYGFFMGWDWVIGTCWYSASAIIALVAVVRPKLLSPLNKAWLCLGLLLGRIVSPIVLGMIFFGLLTPVAIAGRLLGRDELRVKRSVGPSYWIDRNPSGPQPDSFKNQF